MSYLQNSICKFTPLFEIDYKVKKNMISTSLFMRDKYYKKYDMYVDGLRRLVNLLERSDKGFVLRIFIDKHVQKHKGINEIFKSSKKVEPVLFECANYMDGDYHVGLFGTIVRFFPMFDFKNNDRGAMIVTDADLDKCKFPYLKFWMKRKSEHFMAKVDISSMLRGEDIYIMAGGMYVYDTYDGNLLIDFIKNINDYQDKNPYKKKIEEDVKNTRGEDTSFAYGMDEVFINHVMVKDNHIKDIYAATMYAPSYFFWKETYEENEKKIYNECFKIILGKYDKKEYSFNDRLGQLDKILYHIRINFKDKKDKNRKKYRYFAGRFYKMMMKMKKMGKKWFNDEMTKMIYEHLMYKNRGFLIIKYDKENIYSNVEFVKGCF